MSVRMCLLGLAWRLKSRIVSELKLLRRIVQRPLVAQHRADKIPCTR